VTEYVYKTMTSPVGRPKLVASDVGLAAILWENDNSRRVPLTLVAEVTEHPVLLATEQQLREYFAGERREFSIPLDFGGTELEDRRPPRTHGPF